MKPFDLIKWNGKPITKPGIYSGIPLRKYHSPDICDGLSISSTGLRCAWAESLAHFYDSWPGNPKYAPKPVTRPMILGSAAHHLILGEEKFSSEYVGEPDTYIDVETAKAKPWNNNANPCKDWKAKQTKAGRTIVKPDELERIVGMARALKAYPMVTELLHGYIECSGFVKDAETGLWLKIRPDVMPKGDEYVDLKFTAEIITPAVQSSIRTRGYQMQAGLIWEVVDQLHFPFLSFNFLFVENKRPFCVYPVDLPEEDLSQGRRMCRAMLRDINGCLQTKHWPGPDGDDLRTLGVSKEERVRIEERLKRYGLA